MSMIQQMEPGQPITAEWLNQVANALQTVLKAGKDIDIRRLGTNKIVIGSRTGGGGGVGVSSSGLQIYVVASYQFLPTSGISVPSLGFTTDYQQIYIYDKRGAFTPSTAASWNAIATYNGPWKPGILGNDEGEDEGDTWYNLAGTLYVHSGTQWEPMNRLVDPVALG